MLCRTKLALVALLVSVSVADAGPFRRGRRGCSGSSCSQSSGYVECSQQSYSNSVIRDVSSYERREAVVEELPVAKESSKDKRTSSADDALDEVNATRAAHGLRPFLRDRLLTMAARRAANHRAVYCIEGHTSNDFSFIPGGGSAAAAGCGAWMPGDGWGTCCTYDTQYSYAGAAWAIGPDGRRYMHLFVR